MLETTSNVTKGLPEVKTFELSKHVSRNSKFGIMDYLPCPYKIPFKIVFGIPFLLYIVRQTYG